MAPIKYADRHIPKISLSDFSNRVDEITFQLIHAAETNGFFGIVDHGIPASTIDNMFATSEAFFCLPDTTKATVPFSPINNAGWEKNSQVPPSTGVADQKETYQMQFGANMEGMWLPNSELPGFKDTALDFMQQCQEVSEKLMLCFARGLGFPDDYFVKAHDVSIPNSQTVFRLLHYPELKKSVPVPDNYYRAAIHTDFALITLLFQKAGQSGLEICPGREVATCWGMGDVWTKVEPVHGEIICNIGDLLMRWSDDRFKSTLHRVRTPSDPEVDYFGPRYSIAYFNQPCTDCEIQGPLKKYPLVTGEEFTRMAINRNFGAIKAKKEGLADREKAASANAVCAPVQFNA